MQGFVKQTLELFGTLKNKEVIDQFLQADKIRVVGRYTYEKKLTTANVVVEEHFYVKPEDENTKYNTQILVFIGDTPMWGFYKKKFVNCGIRSSGVDNSLVTDLNMKALSNGFERMTEEDFKKFSEVYEAYANCDAKYFQNQIKKEG